MKINRNNWPEWLTDYKEGLLDSDLEKEFLLFLESNEDLREEAEFFGTPVLYPDISIRIDRDSLKKGISDLDTGQMEEMMVALTEGDITGDDAEDLLAYTRKNSEAREILRSVSAIKLNPSAITYPDRDKLIKRSFNKSYKKIGSWLLPAAAVVALLLSMLLFIPGPDTNPAAINTVADLPSIPQPVQPEQQEVIINEVVHTGEDPSNPTNMEPAAGNIVTGSAAQAEEAELASDTFGERETLSDREHINITPASITGIPLLSSEAPGLSLAEMMPADITTGQDAVEEKGFLASNLGNLILKRNETGTDSQGDDLAGATLNGVNKLLGWDMKLEKEKDQEGKVNSVRFSSQLIKIDHKKKTGSD